ncbi:WAT1-related At4g08300-like [Olea europaea subsp. europaea]|uniref:WAT1-related protein n=1 Tax=Olea europaea subsp. europaea TaxID=158383 RepID=A0A8S0S7I5_OLEEU|nr:WAT1-related At4g08300-like [Olea europaea subsp. europaea]
MRMGEKSIWGITSMAFNKMKPYLAMVSLQFGYAGMYIITMLSFKRGFSHWILVVYRHAVATMVFAPFAFFLERKIRPKLTLSVFLKIMLLAFLEPVLDQNLYYVGMKYTSATFTAATINILPGITFIMAVIFSSMRDRIARMHKEAIFEVGLSLKGEMGFMGNQVNGDFGDFMERIVGKDDFLVLVCGGRWRWPEVADGRRVVSRFWFFFLLGGGGRKDLGPLLQFSLKEFRGVKIGGSTQARFVCEKFKLITSLDLAPDDMLPILIGAIIIVFGLYSVVWGKSKENSNSDELVYKENKSHDELPVVYKKTSNILDNVTTDTNVKPDVRENNSLNQEP